MGVAPPMGEAPMEALMDVQKNNGECEVETWGNVNKPAYDSRTRRVRRSEVEESEFAFNVPRANEMNGDIREIPNNTTNLNGGSSSGPCDMGPPLDQACNKVFVMGCEDKFNRLENLIPSGCFGPFPSRKECLQKNKESTLPSSSKSESSKSTEGRIKRRRIRSASSPRSSMHSDGYREIDCPMEKSFDLNTNPQVPSRSCPSEGSSDLGVSCDSVAQ
ncbi:hypothetical protein L2E82_19572 [Cichorium intybus]|uniref:Uncharacterized protein n=1 Tax=Cichorium intybus TaxID=13427 RepID=A0ACB9FCL5_CICIN|nr:hypothetical protein L2E82_19572 [Cichorium intybus]